MKTCISNRGNPKKLATSIPVRVAKFLRSKPTYNNNKFRKSILRATKNICFNTNINKDYKFPPLTKDLIKQRL